MKNIPGSDNLKIDLNGLIYNNKSEIIKLPVKLNRVKLQLFNKEEWYDLDWLKYVSWFEVDELFIRLYRDNIRFKKIYNSVIKSKSGVVMSFIEPLYYNNGYRYIPGFTNYAININGEIINTKTGDKKISYISANGYATINIYDPDKCKGRSVPLHRLLALAWIENDDFVARPYINHIDGDKHNNNLENLEWCSAEENNLHAVDTGLNSNIIKIKVRNAYTGEITYFNTLNSIRQMFGFNTSNLSLKRVINCRLLGYLYNNKYEVKQQYDDTPWFYEKYDVIADDIGKKSLYTIFVYDKKTKKTKVYLTFETLLTKYKIYLHSDNKDDIIEAINIKYPNLEVTYNKNSLEGPYIVYEYPTMKKLYECRTILETSAKTGISRNTIRDDLFSYSKYIYDDKFIIIPSNWKNIDYKEFTYKPITNKRVRLINVETRDKIDFDSIAEMGKYLNVTSNVAYRIYHNKGIYNGFEIRTLDE